MKMPDWIAQNRQQRESDPATADRKRTFLTGVSLGGMGSLRIAFRYPERFGAVTASIEGRCPQPF